MPTDQDRLLFVAHALCGAAVGAHDPDATAERAPQIADAAVKRLEARGEPSIVFAQVRHQLDHHTLLADMREAGKDLARSVGEAATNAPCEQEASAGTCWCLTIAHGAEAAVHEACIGVTDEGELVVAENSPRAATGKGPSQDDCQQW